MITDICFVPHNAYHAREMLSVACEARLRGLGCQFIDITDQFGKDEGARAVLLHAGEQPLILAPQLLDAVRPKSLFVMNDWTNPVHTLIGEAKLKGILTYGLVEGCQDFIDSHVNHIGVGRRRRPYQHAHITLLTGEYSEKYFTAHPHFVVGLPRVEHIYRSLRPAWLGRRADPKTTSRICINLNFSYRLYTIFESIWVEDVVAACCDLGFDYLISQHHANSYRNTEMQFSAQPLNETLLDCDVLVSRFSTVIYEAQAMGLPVVYYNPHGEIVDTFQDSLGSFPCATNPEELRVALEQVVTSPRSLTERDEFLKYHISIDEELSAQKRICNIMENMLTTLPA